MLVNINQAIEALKRGEVISFPTETVYGLGGSIHSEQALQTIFRVKERPFFDPLIVHIANEEEAKKLVTNWSPLEHHLAQKFWPGPLTIVSEKQIHVSDLITSGLNTVGLRVPNHPLTLELLKQAGPLAGPSANKFGRTSPTTADHVENEFNGRIDVLDGGPCAGGIESTVIYVSQSKTIEILRPGLITEEELRIATNDFATPVTITHTQSIATPGHMPHHYQPTKPLVLIPRRPTIDDLETIRERLDLASIENSMEIVLSKTPQLAARELYAELRKASDSRAPFLWLNTKSIEDTGLWNSIKDRLSKAQSMILD